MRLPDEIVVESFLPTFRYMLARELEAGGLKEGEIAAKMGLSQAAISKYRRGKTRTQDRFLNDKETQQVVKELAEGMLRRGTSTFQAMSTIIQLIRKHESRGLLCELHEDEVPEISSMGCSLCTMPRGGDVMEEEIVLSNVRTALRTLESTRDFTRLIPNVGSNIAMAKKGAKDTSDIAAVPGRIYEMKGAVKIPAAPELNASKHVAGMILAVSKNSPEVRAAINIRNSEEILRACKDIGWTLVEIEAKYEGREADVAQKLSKFKESPQVIYHNGGFGIEPIVYIIGETAVDVVERIKKLAEKMGI